MFDRTEPAIGRTSRQTEAIPQRNCGCLSAFFIFVYLTRQHREVLPSRHTGVTYAPVLGDVYRQVPLTFGF